MMKLLLVMIFIIIGLISFSPQVKAQRGPVPPSGRSPCEYIPGRGTGHCVGGRR